MADVLVYNPIVDGELIDAASINARLTPLYDHLNPAVQGVGVANLKAKFVAHPDTVFVDSVPAGVTTEIIRKTAYCQMTLVQATAIVATIAGGDGNIQIGIDRDPGTGFATMLAAIWNLTAAVDVQKTAADFSQRTVNVGDKYRVTVTSAPGEVASNLCFGLLFNSVIRETA